jgi:TusA-related sulfurtransferase
MPKRTRYNAVAVIDVEEMLCAQARAVVAQAVERLSAGEAVGVRYNAEDVRRDLVAWAQGFGHEINVEGRSVLMIVKR